jgi:acetolactate synthase I/II/III large subunit
MSSGKLAEHSPESTTPATARSTPRNTADLLVLTLAQQGVEQIFLNPGTDTAPVQDALAHCAASGARVPRVVTCAHEAVALAAAHGYFALTGRPQVVMVHVDVGTQNLGSMMHNAFRGEAGVVVIAGLTPTTWNGEQPGGRDAVVHWHQDVPDQTGIVRSYVKLTGELRTPESLPGQIARALQLATSAPAGPVYLTVAREVLMQPTATQPTTPSRQGAATPTAPGPEVLVEVARVLAYSERPVITTSRVGRDPAAVDELVRLAELLGAPVVDRRERLNLPTTHPCYVPDAGSGAVLLAEADAILVVDSDVPWIPLRAAPGAHATVVQVDADPVRRTTPGWGFEADHRVQADPRIALRELYTQVSRVGGPGLARHGAERLAALAARADEQRSRQRDNGIGPGSAMLSVTAVVQALDDVLDDDDIVIEEAVTNSEVLRCHLRRTRPATLFQSGGSGLGWGVPGAVGAKLAMPQRRVVSVVGDGSFLFASPTASLLAALEAAAPVMVVVLQNGGYAASSRPVHELFPDEASPQDREVVGTRFAVMPDFAKLADACHAHGEHVHRPEELDGAMQRALDATAHGRSAVVVAHVGSPWLPDPSTVAPRGERR